MTTSVKIRNDNAVNYGKLVQVIAVDIHSETGAKAVTTLGVIRQQEEMIFHIHGTRDLMLREIPQV